MTPTSVEKLYEQLLAELQGEEAGIHQSPSRWIPASRWKNILVHVALCNIPGVDSSGCDAAV